MRSFKANDEFLYFSIMLFHQFMLALSGSLGSNSSKLQLLAL